MVADADGNSSAIDQTIQSDQQPATPHLSISKDRSGLPRGDVFYFADTGQLDERLDGRRPCLTPSQQTQTQTAARKSLPTEPQHPRRMRSKPRMPLSGRTKTTRGKTLSWPKSLRASGRPNKLPTVPRRLRFSEASCGESTRPPQRIGGRGWWSNGGGGNPGGPRRLLSASRPLECQQLTARQRCTAACLRLASGLGCQHRDIAARPRWAAVTLSFRPGFGELSTSLPPAGYKDPVQR